MLLSCVVWPFTLILVEQHAFKWSTCNLRVVAYLFGTLFTWESVKETYCKLFKVLLYLRHDFFKFQIYTTTGRMHTVYDQPLVCYIKINFKKHCFS